MQWFSAKVRVAVLIETKGLVNYMDSVYVFRSPDFPEAFEKALALGKGAEEEYLNGDQQLVRWKFKEIISLDLLRNGIQEDGTEVYSEPVYPSSAEQYDLDYEFEPEKSQPTQTV